jgi:hypothetical protein
MLFQAFHKKTFAGLGTLILQIAFHVSILEYEIEHSPTDRF